MHAPVDPEQLGRAVLDEEPGDDRRRRDARSRRSSGSRVAATAAATATITSAKNGMIASQPCPTPPMLTTVAVKLPWPIRESQWRVSSSWSRGSALVATTITPAETSASAPTVAGRRRSAGASAKQRNGRSGIRKRGPGDQPPSANAVGWRAEFQTSSTTVSAAIRPASARRPRRQRSTVPAAAAATTGVTTRRPRWLSSTSTSTRKLGSPWPKKPVCCQPPRLLAPARRNTPGAADFRKPMR